MQSQRKMRNAEEKLIEALELYLKACASGCLSRTVDCKLCCFKSDSISVYDHYGENKKICEVLDELVHFYNL